MRLGLPEEEAELGGAMEASPVGHREDEDAHVALQRGQILRYKHMNKPSAHSRSAVDRRGPVTAGEASDVREPRTDF